eukprot:g73878.t1
MPCIVHSKCRTKKSLLSQPTMLFCFVLDCIVATRDTKGSPSFSLRGLCGRVRAGKSLGTRKYTTFCEEPNVRTFWYNTGRE